MHSTCAVLYCHLWPVCVYHIFPHYLINGTIFEKKKKSWTQNELFFFLQTLAETFLIRRKILEWPCILSYKYVGLLVKYRYYCQILMQIFTKVLPMGGELFRADGQTQTDRQTDRRDEAHTIHFTQFLESDRIQKMYLTVLIALFNVLK